MLSARTGPHACAPQDNFSGRRFRERTLNSGEPVQLNLHLCSPPGSAARSVSDYYRAGCDRSGAGAARATARPDQWVSSLCLPAVN